MSLDKSTVSVANPTQQEREEALERTSTVEGAALPRCELELHTEQYFGLPEDVTENHKLSVDYGILVNFLATFRDKIDVPDAADYDNAALTKIEKHLDAALDICLNVDFESESAQQIAQDLIDYLNPKLVVLQRVINEPSIQ